MTSNRFKTFLISAHCAGWLPAWVVTAAFRIFKLRGR